MGPLQGQKFCQQAFSRVGFTQGHSFLQVSTCSGMGSTRGCRWISVPLWSFMGCRSTASYPTVFIMGCMGISALVPGASPAPPTPLTLESAELFVSHILTSLSWQELLLCSNFWPFKNLIPEALPQSLMGSALVSSWSTLKQCGIGFVRHGGSPPHSPALSKPGHINPVQRVIPFLQRIILFFQAQLGRGYKDHQMGWVVYQ